MSDHNCNDDIRALTMIDEGEADGDMIDGVETAEDTAPCENYELWTAAVVYLWHSLQQNT